MMRQDEMGGHKPHSAAATGPFIRLHGNKADKSSAYLMPVGVKCFTRCFIPLVSLQEWDIIMSILRMRKLRTEEIK